MTQHNTKKIYLGADHLLRNTKIESVDRLCHKLSMSKNVSNLNCYKILDFMSSKGVT